MASPASTARSACTNSASPVSSVSVAGTRYAVVFDKSYTSQTLPSTDTKKTFATLDEAKRYLDVFADVLTETHEVERKKEHNTGKTNFINKAYGEKIGSLWIEKLEPDFVEVVRQADGVQIPKPRLEVKASIWHDEDKIWEVLVEDRLTKATRTFTLHSFASPGAKPWERKGVWDDAGTIVVDADVFTSTGKETGVARKISYTTFRRNHRLDAVYAPRSWRS